MAETKNKEAAMVARAPKMDDQVLARVNQLAESGFTMPKDFNYVNAVKMSWLKLQEVKDRNGKPALEVCTQTSIASALFKMCTKGLNAGLNQCYLIVRGNQLCCDPSYFGNILQVKRIFPDWEPSAHTIREGDEFEFAIDQETGHRRLIKHVQTLESMDKPFVGGYVILPTNDGKGDLYIMTKKQILAAWSKSSSKEQAVHKTFDERMVGKTVINSGCNTIINSTTELNASDDDDNLQNDAGNDGFAPAEEVVDTETGEVKQLDAPDNEPEAPADEAPSQEQPAAPESGDDDF